MHRPQVPRQVDQLGEWRRGDEIGRQQPRQIPRETGIGLRMRQQCLAQRENLAQQIPQARHHPAQVRPDALQLARKDLAGQRYHRPGAGPAAQRGVGLLLQGLDG